MLWKMQVGHQFFPKQLALGANTHLLLVPLPRLLFAMLPIAQLAEICGTVEFAVSAAAYQCPDSRHKHIPLTADEEEAAEAAEAAEEEEEEEEEEEAAAEEAAEEAVDNQSKRRKPSRRKPSKSEPQRRQTRSQDAGQAAERGGRGRGRARG